MAAHDQAGEDAERFINDLMDDFDARWITGNGTGDLSRGFMPRDHPGVHDANVTPPITTSDVPEALRGHRRKR